MSRTADNAPLPPDFPEAELPAPGEDAEDDDGGSALVVRSASTANDPIPRLREVRVQLVKLDEKNGSEAQQDEPTEGANNVVLLEDPEGIATRPAVISVAAYTLSTFFNGMRNAGEVAGIFNDKYGQAISAEQVLDLQHELDKSFFLYSRRFERALRRHVRGYLENSVRPAVHAGTSYPEASETLRQTVTGFFNPPYGPGVLDQIPAAEIAQSDTVRGLIVPHVDLRVGGATYAHGYRELICHSQAELFVILGVAHQSIGDNLFYVSQKDFATPGGVVRTNRSIARRLLAAADAEHVVAELAHRTEHSVEFQAVLLHALLAERYGRNVEIVPVLCGSVDNFLAEEEDPTRAPAFKRFIQRLGAELEESKKKWCVLCSVDFSHVGPEFGNSTMIGERVLPPIERGDRRVLKHIEKLDTEGFVQEVQRTQNSRHMDAILAVLTMLEACRGTFNRARLLQYDQMLKTATHSAVSYCSVAFEK